MRIRALIAGLSAVVLVVGAVVWWQAGSDRGENSVVVSAEAQPVLGGVARPLADVGDVLEGRRPELFVDLPWVLAASGTDYELGNTSTLLAVSDDAGESFRSIEFGQPVAAPKAVLHGDSAVLVGLRCEPPVETSDAVCETAAADQVAFHIDLASGAFSELPPAPVDGTIVSAIGAAEQASVFLAQTADGEQVLTVEPDGTWSAAAAPAGSESVCAIDGTLVAIASAAPFTTSSTSSDPGDPSGPPQTVPDGAEMPEVAEGEPLWQAMVSEDGGQSWSTPIPFRSGRARDLSFVLGVTCGPRFVMVNTAQLAAFDPGERRWMPVELPPELDDSIAPGTASTWASAEDFVIWTLSEALAPPSTDSPSDRLVESPPRATRAVEVTGVGTPNLSVDAGPRVELSAGQPADLLSPSAEANGFVMEIGNDVALGRIG